LPLVPVGVRLDAAYDRFGFDRTPVGAAGTATGAQQIVSGTVNATVHLPAALPLLSPYAIGGLGPYRLSCSGVASCESETRMGWNAGVGIRFGLLLIHGFAEARYHYVPATGGSVQYVPITVGLLF
jgi:opacity protein-like surface antigen